MRDVIFERTEIFLQLVERIAVALEKLAEDKPDEDAKRQVEGFKL